MALTTNIPPQAYTRDTLVKAIEWLGHQPASVREKATSADLVVSFYLQANRRKTALQMEAPVSGENFKADLRHLAEDLKQFEEPSAPPTPVVHLFSQAEPIFKPEPIPQPVHVHVPHPREAVRSEPPVKPTTWPVDNRTLAAARELQQRLNLSSEVEALRMLVTMGAERARALFP